MSSSPPRVVLVTGKGGVGKTTTAAALAAAAARRGLRALVMSTDVAHSLGDTLDLSLPVARSWDQVTKVPRASRSGGRLCALAVDSHTTVGANWGVVQDYLLDLLHGVGADPVLADELTRLPGADDLTSLLALSHHAESREWDLIVVDCAPSGETLRLLALPELVGWHLDRILPVQRRLLTALRPAAIAASGLVAPGPDVLGVVRAWRQRMAQVRRLLTSPQASVRIVLTPERVVIAEARRLHSSLVVHGYAVDEILVNRVLPPSDDPWQAAWNAAQAEGIGEVLASFDGIPVRSAPYRAGEPVGTTALCDFEAATTAIRGPVADLLAPVEVSAMEVITDGPDFILRIPAPEVTSGTLDLTRRGDDLVLEVAGTRRVITLPSVLRRCIVQNASVGAGTLRVRFERDEEVWPRAAT